jgi:hypothetical protein
MKYEKRKSKHQIEAMSCVAEFYGLEALLIEVHKKHEPFKKSHERLIRDIKEYKELYVEKLADAIYDYSVMVCYGEMRHAKNHSTHYSKHISQTLNRGASYLESLEYNPTDILNLAEKSFSNDVEWGGAYGGEKWRLIANRVNLRPYLTNQIFCDMCFSLSHNNSPYLDKSSANIFCMNSRNEYKELLDIKFSNSTGQIIRIGLEFGGERFSKLVYRAIQLGVTDVTMYKWEHYKGNNKYYTHAEDLLLDYEKIEWGNERLPNELIQHRVKLKYPLNSIKDNPFIVGDKRFISGQRVIYNNPRDRIKNIPMKVIGQEDSFIICSTNNKYINNFSYYLIIKNRNWKFFIERNEFLINVKFDNIEN